MRNLTPKIQKAWADARRTNPIERERIMKYNHAVDIAFEVISNDEQGEDITPDMLRKALQKRVDELDRTNNWLAAVDIFDTMEKGA